MPWPSLLASYLAPVTPGVSPVDSAVGYIFNYGVLGIVVVAFAFRFIVPRSAVEDARIQARADLARENERLIREKAHAEEQRDDALKVARDQVAPLLIQFNATVTALIPLLQELVARRESQGRNDGR